MLVTALLAVAVLQNPQGNRAQQQAAVAALPPSPVARIEITPQNPVMVSGDTLRLSAVPRDGEGRAIPNARVRFFAAGGRFEGSVDSSGLVQSGQTGTIPVTIVALVEGSRPFTRRVDVRMVPGAATTVRLENTATKMIAGQRLRATARGVSAASDVTHDTIQWRSSAPAVAAVDANGMVTGRGPGRATITARAGEASATWNVQIVANTIARVDVQPANTNAKQGDVIRLTARAYDRAGLEITGLTPSWTFSPGQGLVEPDGAFVGYEPGAYVVTASFGVATGDAAITLATRDVRRPVQVVGRLPRTLHTTEEVWVHPNGRYAYLGTGRGGDRMYTIDISNPANPVVTDSIVANTRRVNDIMTTADGRTMVFTREGASDRRNGIVIASLEDPAHPRVISEFTEGVTAGVHSAFVYTQPRHGTHVYLTNDGTGAFHIIDISDPVHPRQVAEWRTSRPDAGRSLHDVDVQNGLAYLSYWNDGLIILDVGNGMRGGSPSNPQLVSQFKYDLNAMYRDVEARAGGGFIRGTHTAWRHNNYVFIADEVFPAAGVEGARDAAAGRAFGRLQVVDISDLANPRSVAWYEPEYGGVHNVWVAGDTLYMGAYNAGFRAFDISGELRGDLRAQQREIVHLNTADMQGAVQNTAMTWGVVVKDGLAYVNDIHNGLWIVRIKQPVSPAVP